MFVGQKGNAIFCTKDKLRGFEGGIYTAGIFLEIAGGARDREI